MKKIIALALAALMVLSLVGCAAGTANKKEDGVFNVVAVVGVGGLGDESFNDSIWAGCQQAAAADETVKIQVVEPAEAAEFEGHYTELAKTGKYDLIIGSGFDAVETVSKIAPEFPEQKFLFVDGNCGELDNVASVVFRDEEKAFLLGILAGMQTETGKIGFVGGMDIPSINMFAAGFEAGVAYSNPEATVERKYVGGFADSSTGKELALALYDGGCDIVYAAAGGSGLGCFAAAAERNLYVIGADVNQNVLDPDHCVVSGIRTLDLIIANKIAEAKASETGLAGGVFSAGLKENGVDYVREGSNVAVADEIIAAMDEAKAKVIAGEIAVPSALENVQDFISTYCK